MSEKFKALLAAEKKAFDACRDCHFEDLGDKFRDLMIARQLVWDFCLAFTKETLCSTKS